MMCDSCAVHVPGPGEVAGGALGLAVGAAISKPGRRILFWTVCVPALPFAIWGELHWWTLVPVAMLAAVAAGTFAVTRVLHRTVVQTRPELTHEMRAKLAARGLKPIPAPGRQAQPALPRAVRRQLPGWRLTATVIKARAARPAEAIPAAKAIEPTRVLPARRAK